MRDRFLSKIKDDHSPCWEWEGYINKGGYGTFKVGSASLLAHRVSYELFNGRIPDGCDVNHLCNNPRCVHPKHLCLGDDQSNMNYKVKFRRQYRKVTDEDVVEIRRMYASGDYSQPDLAETFGISQSAVSHIVSGKVAKFIDLVDCEDTQKTSQRGSKNGRSVLTEEDVLRIKRLHRSGKITQALLAQIFGSSKTVISGIIKGKYWSHVQI